MFSSTNDTSEIIFWLKLCVCIFILCILALRYIHKEIVMKMSLYHCEPGFMFFRVLEGILIVISFITGLVSILSLMVMLGILWMIPTMMNYDLWASDFIYVASF